MYASTIQRVLVVLSWTTIAACFVPQSAAADSFWNQLFDVSDGQFDVSSLVASDRGFLPVPILITEPAIGYGGGMAAVFFHEDAEEAEKRRAAMASDQDDISGLLPPTPACSWAPRRKTAVGLPAGAIRGSGWATGFAIWARPAMPPSTKSFMARGMARRWTTLRKQRR